ncbi:hypothetical protein JTE90_010729 [Oedothorax gibbosus]|uniref:Uncharacterized protein n=1 Tax=Oedothorax gibbosus TaxID=931172 RepID=A0AAV6UNW4_9ARAC|nr:hypothetical protein JTE90_010729 [Oedothorax gibbosus]
MSTTPHQVSNTHNNNKHCAGGITDTLPVVVPCQDSTPQMPKQVSLNAFECHRITMSAEDPCGLEDSCRQKPIL